MFLKLLNIITAIHCRRTYKAKVATVTPIPLTLPDSGIPNPRVDLEPVSKLQLTDSEQQSQAI